MKEEDHRVVGEEHGDHKCQSGVLSIEAVVVGVKGKLVEVEEAQKVPFADDRTSGHRVKLVRRPDHDDDVKGNARVVEEFKHDC